MKHLFNFFLIYLLSFTPGFSQPVTLQKTFGGLKDDSFHQILFTSDSNYIISGATGSFNTVNGASWLVKIDKNGDSLWTKTFDTKFHEGGGYLEPTGEGGYVLSRSVWPDTHKIPPYDSYYSIIELIKIDSNANILWNKYYGGAMWSDFVLPCGNYGSSSVKLTSDGGFLIFGSRSSLMSCGQPTSIFLIKTNSIGDTLWTKILYSPDFGDWSGSYIEETNDSNYIITGQGNSASTVDTKIYLVKIDTLGKVIWNRSFGALGSNRNNGYSVQQTSDGGYIICGDNNDLNDLYFVFIIKTNNLGNTLWTKSFNSNNSSKHGLFAKEIERNEYIITGIQQSDLFIGKIDSLGNILWNVIYGETGGIELGLSATFTSDSRLIIVGSAQSFGAGSEDGYLIITDSLGKVYPRANAGIDSKICINDSVIIGSPPLIGQLYNWTSVPLGFSSQETQPIVSPVQPTIYIVSTTNSIVPEPAIDSVFVGIFPLPSASFVLGIDNNKIVLNNTSSYSNNFLWDFGDSTNDTAFAPTHQYLTDGAYTLKLTASNECGTDTATQIIDITTGNIDKDISNSNSSSLNITYNPIDKFLTIGKNYSYFKNSIIRIKINSMEGKVLQNIEWKHDVKNSHFKINLNHFPQGLYVVNLFSEDEFISKKIIIMK